LRVSILALVFLCLLLGTDLACAVTWSEITRFPKYWGTAPYVLREERTDNFTCSHVEWRIVWSYTPIPIVAEQAEFNIAIYRTNETNYIMSMNQGGNTTTNGTMYVNNLPGEFYLKFVVYNVLNSTAVIEQDIESMAGWLVADAGPDKTVDEDVQAQFDGSGSADDIGIISYVWTFVDSTPVTLTGKTPTYTFSNPDNYTVTLNVTDAAGNWATDVATITVRDITPPSIGTISQSPSGDVDEGQLVKVSANITDAASGVKNASVIYSIDNGSSWHTPLPMVYNSTTGLYETTILENTSGTWVKYKIIAYDTAGNLVTENNAGQYYSYQIIPELPTTYAILLFILATTLAVTTCRKSKRCFLK